MDLQERIHLIDNAEELTEKEIDIYWSESLNGDKKAQESLAFYYMKKLLRIKPLYAYLSEETFYEILEKSVLKALDRGLKFQIKDFDSYMNMASQTYFKFHMLPENESLHIPVQLIKAFSKLDEVFHHISKLNDIEEKEQMELLSKGFEYPLFSTRLLYYSFKKWKNNSLRQVDIDLTSNLLPGPQRMEWEIFYEKPIEDVEKKIIHEIGL